MQTAAHIKLPTKSEWNLHGIMPDVSAVRMQQTTVIWCISLQRPYITPPLHLGMQLSEKERFCAKVPPLFSVFAQVDGREEMDSKCS